MKKFNKSIGTTGENIACNLLLSEKYNIIKKNFNCRNGEIDIIGWDKEILCFIEVKTRYDLGFGSPMEAVSFSKVLSIKRVAKYFIHKYQLYNVNARFDIIEVYLNHRNAEIKTNLIKDAFR